MSGGFFNLGIKEGVFIAKFLRQYFEYLWH